jgi:transposase
MRYLEIAKTIDELVPQHPLNHVSTGECVEALVLSILTGEHALYNVSEVLSQYDTSVIFQKEVEPNWFHDNRLGNSLDDLKNVGLDNLYSALISKAIIKHTLGLSHLHSDTTSLSLYGEYRGYSVIRPYVYETEEGKKVERTMRFLVVESTTLEKKKGKKIDTGISAEEEEIIQTANNLKKRVFACEKCAQMEASKIKEKKKVLYHSLNFDVKKVEVPVKRGRGRPKNDEKVPTEDGWVIEPDFSLDKEKVEGRRKSESHYVLATSVLVKEKLPDDEFLKVYKGQAGVESIM